MEWTDGVVYNSGTRASGGMANGYLAVDVRGGKTIPCWLKAHICRNEQDAQYIQRLFLYECELLDYLKDRGYVSAPHVVRRVELDAGPDGQQRVWYLMTEAEGEDWGSMQFQDERTLHKGLYELAKALAELHKRGVGHFDLKPGEILNGKKKQGNIKCNVRTGKVMLIDFGTAIGPEWWQMADAEHHTNPLRKTLVGSKPWVSPEQEKLPIGQLTRHSDVYVYGLLFCKAILDREVAMDEPRDRLAAELLQQVPQDLAELVAQQALAIEPAQRAGTLEELLVAMQAAGWSKGLRDSKRGTAAKAQKSQKSQCAKCGSELIEGKCPVCNGPKKRWHDWKILLGAVIGILVIGWGMYWKSKQETKPSSAPIMPSSPSPAPSAAPQAPRPIKTYTNWFMVGDRVYTNYVVKSGERCPAPVPPAPPNGNGDFLRWEDLWDEAVFDPNARVYASKTWVARFERIGSPSTQPFPLANWLDDDREVPSRQSAAPSTPSPVETYTNRFMVGNKVYTNYVVKSGERCPVPASPSPPKGKGDFLRWVNVDDETVFDPDARVHASKTWVARFDRIIAPAPQPSSRSNVVAPAPKPESIHLVFTGRDGWSAERDVLAGEELGSREIPAAPDLSNNGLGFSHWGAKGNQSRKYDFGAATTDMPREFVAVYTNLPIRIEYVVDGEVTRRDDWYTADPIPRPASPKKDGFEFRGWLDELGWPWDPAYYKAHYVPAIRLTAKFEEAGAWPTLTVVVEGKGAGLMNSATVRIMKPSTRECVFTQTVECVSSKDASMVIKADQYRGVAPDTQPLMATISDAQGKQVGTSVLLKLNGQDQKVTVPVSWTEDELKKADGLCSELHRIYEAHLGYGAKNPASRVEGRIRDCLALVGPLFKGMGYDTFGKLYSNLPSPELTSDELEALKEYWP